MEIYITRVLPTYQGQGIGRELVMRMLELLDGIYMIDLLCDEELQGYYEKLGCIVHGMVRRKLRDSQGSKGRNKWSSIR